MKKKTASNRKSDSVLLESTQPDVELWFFENFLKALSSSWKSIFFYCYCIHHTFRLVVEYRKLYIDKKEPGRITFGRGGRSVVMWLRLGTEKYRMQRSFSSRSWRSFIFYALKTREKWIIFNGKLATLKIAKKIFARNDGWAEINQVTGSARTWVGERKKSYDKLPILRIGGAIKIHYYKNCTPTLSSKNWKFSQL